eukprot:m.191387 g.191387  ORF g.191387 m.191387 type:complete len:380 (-) comp18323_c0_seq1:39-1178(-)
MQTSLTRAVTAAVLLVNAGVGILEVNGKTVTIHNDQPRRAVDGSYVDAHDGKIVAVNGTYFLYGESYGNQTLAQPYPWAQWPRLRVYTSPDLVTWTDRGDPLPMETGTLWIPNVIYHEQRKLFIMWYGSGVWATATSTDGIHFTPAGPKFASRFGPAPGTDGTGIFIDDDGTGYVAFASSPPGCDHCVSIERMTPDLLKSSLVNVTGFFPDDYVESPSLFKHGSTYYLTYGSCCCGCDEGGGQVVYSAPKVSGPWTRQAPHADINCDASLEICGGFGKRAGQVNDLVYHAQWWGPSFIPLADGSTQVMYLGRRWLSGPNVPSGCHDICGNRGDPAACQAGGANYEFKSDYSVWYPLEFDNATGNIATMRPLSSFTLELP